MISNRVLDNSTSQRRIHSKITKIKSLEQQQSLFRQKRLLRWLSPKPFKMLKYYKVILGLNRRLIYHYSKSIKTVQCTLRSTGEEN